MQPIEYPARGTDSPENAASTSLVPIPSKSAPERCKHTLVDPNLNLTAPLKGLAPEIRRHLLFMMEFEPLKSLVHASPVFYQQHLEDRKWVICRSLAATFRSSSLIYEIGAVYESGLEIFWETRTENIMTQFVQAYQNGRSSSHNSQFSESMTLSGELSLDATTFMMKYYSRPSSLSS
jgi:hypothetical protein